VITTAASGSIDRTIGQELRRPITEQQIINGVTKEVPIAYKFGGGNHLAATIEVVSNDTSSPDRIMDWILIYLRWFFIEKFRAFGLNIEDISINPGREEYIGNQQVYVNSITLNLFTEWNHIVSVEDATRLQDICITNIFVVNYDGTTN
jgi:hypothetical protein